MKKTLIMLALVAFAGNAKGQWQLTTEGLILPNGDRYQVYEMPEITKANLYKSALLYLNKAYSNPNEVLTLVQDEMITISAKETNIIRRNKMHVFDLNYTISLEFKEGKMKVNAPDFLMTAYYNSNRQVLGIAGTNALNGSNVYIFTQKGKLKSELAKADLEAFFNAYIANLIQGMKGKDW